MTKPPTLISDLKPADLCAKLGLSRSYAFELVNRVKTPSLDVAVRIEREFGVPAMAWLDKPASQNDAAA